jgi:hypothetical protein
MLLRHPLLVIAHMLEGLREARHPRKLERDNRLRSRKAVAAGAACQVRRSTRQGRGGGTKHSTFVAE